MIEQKGKYWWPTDDDHGFAAAQWEVSHIDKMISFCGKKRLAVQAGGNVGIFPIELAKSFERVFTFEPDKTNFDCLQKNVSGINNMEIFNVGLGNRHMTSGMRRLKNNCGAHYMEGQGDVVIVPLDDFDIENCDFLQLDVEGYEYLALEGAKSTIERCHPVIVCEEKGLGKFHGITNEAITCFLLEFGYKIAGKIANDVIYTWHP